MKVVCFCGSDEWTTGRQCANCGRDMFNSSSLVPGPCPDCAQLKARVAELEAEIADQERSTGQVIDERDWAQDVIAAAVGILDGNSEWSSQNDLHYTLPQECKSVMSRIAEVEAENAKHEDAIEAMRQCCHDAEVAFDEAGKLRDRIAVVEAENADLWRRLGLFTSGKVRVTVDQRGPLLWNVHTESKLLIGLPDVDFALTAAMEDER